MDIREVAPAAAGDGNLLADALRVFQDNDTPAPFARLDRAEEPGGARANNNYFVMHKW